MFAARVKTELIKAAEKALNLVKHAYQRKSYRDMFYENYGYDPLKCCFCGTPMVLMNVKPVNTSTVKLLCMEYNDTFKRKRIS